MCACDSASSAWRMEFTDMWPLAPREFFKPAHPVPCLCSLHECMLGLKRSQCL